jgi:acyl-CoA synthetase (AMP-forming)/AMP-acid ligase II
MAYILRETGTHADLAALDKAWSRNETFLFMPPKSPIEETDVLTLLDGLPTKMQVDHFILLTSGSTGRPKLVVGARSRAEALARQLHIEQDSDDVENAIMALPLSYCYSFVNQWLWARTHGRNVVYTNGLADPTALRDALTTARSSMLCLVGSQLSLLTSGWGDEVFFNVHRLHFAGGRFPYQHFDVLAARFPNARIYNNYGCAEAMPRLTLRLAESQSDSFNIGWPLDGIELSIGEQGNLRFRSPFSAVAQETGSGFEVLDQLEWTDSGDLAECQPDGSYRLLGRSNEVFKRFGEKVSLSALLETVRTAGWDPPAQFITKEDTQGEIGYVLVLEGSPKDTMIRQILKAFRTLHPRALWPLAIESVEHIPLLANGKIDAQSLAQQSNSVTHWKNRI